LPPALEAENLQFFVVFIVIGRTVSQCPLHVKRGLATGRWRLRKSIEKV